MLREKINKTTAVWLFSEGERVSSDRLFRERAKQPYSSGRNSSRVLEAPARVCDHVTVGDLCVFQWCPKQHKEYWTIGKVLITKSPSSTMAKQSAFLGLEI